MEELPQNQVAVDKSEENLKSHLDFQISWRDTMARMLTYRLGSVWFLCSTVVFIGGWVLVNIGVLGTTPFDPFPFGWLVTLVPAVSMMLSTIVLINQNRDAKIDEIRNRIELEINVRTERETTKILRMLDEIHQEIGIAKVDRELEEMKEETDIAEIKEEIEDVIKKE